MKQTSITRTIAEFVIFLIGVLLLFIIAAITHIQNNTCADEQKIRQDYVCHEMSINA